VVPRAKTTWIAGQSSADAAPTTTMGRTAADEAKKAAAVTVERRTRSIGTPNDNA
jgi:hypothetical protein